ncbi:MAG TPA: DUF72 domain-containing protein [Acidobacteriaceae bacterium]|nr:DUF72 domain-containing protein [Acidobacteriaceae bacterium]
MSGSGVVRIGISGWTYPPWRGVFFPKKLPQNRELEYAAGIFRTIEINGTFYSLQRPSSYQSWAERTPEDFMFSVKAPRYITHMLRLRGVETAVANFFASGVLKLGAKLGPILWQLPPNFQYSRELIESFLQLLPRNTNEAVEIGKKHDKKVEGRTYLETDRNRPLRHALEIRHVTFVVPEFVALLRKYKVALVCADTVDWPRLMDLTSDFVYCRLHGSKVLYSSGYGKVAIEEWATRVAAWAKGSEPSDAECASTKKAAMRAKRDVFVYFDNDAKVRAPRDAKRLQARMEELLLGCVKPEDPPSARRVRSLLGA